MVLSSITVPAADAKASLTASHHHPGHRDLPPQRILLEGLLWLRCKAQPLPQSETPRLIESQGVSVFLLRDTGHESLVELDSHSQVKQDQQADQHTKRCNEPRSQSNSREVQQHDNTES